MKKLLLPLLAVLLFTSCQKQISADKVPQEIGSVTASRTTQKITICHHDAVTGTNKSILINATAWPQHQAHGDIQGDCSAVITTICGKDWMVKNLDVSTYRNGDPIPQVTDATAWEGLTTGAWCYFNNDPANGVIYGKLYNFYTVHDTRGLAPTGWHVPGDAEWTTLSTCLGDESVAGIAMKSSSGWYENGNGTNSSGFTGLPGGYRFEPYGSINLLRSGSWWSNTEVNPDGAWSRFLNFNVDYLLRDNSFKQAGFSVRCVRD